MMANTYKKLNPPLITDIFLSFTVGMIKNSINSENAFAYFLSKTIHPCLPLTWLAVPWPSRLAHIIFKLYELNL